MILHLTAKTETWSLINSSTISHSISENQPFLKEPVVAVTLPSQLSTMVSIGFCRSFMEIDGEDYLRTSITGSFLDLSIHGKAYRIPLDTRSPTPDSMFSYSACNKRHEVKNKDSFEEGSNSSRSSTEDPPLKRTYFRLSVQKVPHQKLPLHKLSVRDRSTRNELPVKSTFICLKTTPIKQQQEPVIDLSKMQVVIREKRPVYLTEDCTLSHPVFKLPKNLLGFKTFRCLEPKLDVVKFTPKRDTKMVLSRYPRADTDNSVILRTRESLWVAPGFRFHQSCPNSPKGGEKPHLPPRPTSALSASSNSVRGNLRFLAPPDAARPCCGATRMLMAKEKGAPWRPTRLNTNTQSSAMVQRLEKCNLSRDLQRLENAHEELSNPHSSPRFVSKLPTPRCKYEVMDCTTCGNEDKQMQEQQVVRDEDSTSETGEYESEPEPELEPEPQPEPGCQLEPESQPGCSTERCENGAFREYDGPSRILTINEPDSIVLANSMPNRYKRKFASLRAAGRTWKTKPRLIPYPTAWPWYWYTTFPRSAKYVANEVEDGTLGMDPKPALRMKLGPAVGEGSQENSCSSD